MRSLSRHGLMIGGLVLLAVGAAGMTYAAWLASGAVFRRLGEWVLANGSLEFPALAAVCGGVVTMAGIGLLAASRRPHHRAVYVRRRSTSRRAAPADALEPEAGPRQRREIAGPSVAA